MIQFRSCVQTNGVTERDVKEVIKKQFENATNVDYNLQFYGLILGHLELIFG